MKTTYAHFCLAARTLETVGDRWSLLIVRDLLPGRRRFSDLRRLLTTVTPKWLTIRLRELEAAGIVVRDRQPGRREVWYELTDKGRDLAPVLEALIAWGLKHGRDPLAPDEQAHPDHLVAGLVVALNQTDRRWPRGARAWRFEFDDAQNAYVVAFDGDRWSLDGERPADVVVSTTARAWAEFVVTPFAKRRLPSRDIRLSGSPRRVAELVRAFQSPPGALKG